MKRRQSIEELQAIECALGFPFRNNQRALFREVLRETGVTGLDAPTGIGKSLAVALFGGQRVVYSAHTKALQRQMRDDVAPLLVSAGLFVDVQVLFGQRNYICLRRAAGRGLRIIGDGSRENYRGLTDSEWAQVCSNSLEGCSPEGCSGDAYDAARERAGRADLLIVNHALLGRNVVTPNDRVLIVDEAHHLADALSEVATLRASDLFALLARASSHGIEVAAMRLAAAGWAAAAREAKIGSLWTGYSVSKELVAETQSAAGRAWTDGLMGLAIDLEGLADQVGLFTGPEPGYVATVELGGARVRAVDVSYGAARLFESYSRTVLMSATLEGPSLDRIDPGENCEILSVGSPFDLEQNRLGYVTPSRVRDNTPHQWDERELMSLVEASEGGALVFASSHHQKSRAVQALLRGGWTVGVQNRTEDISDLVAGLKDRRYDVVVGTAGVGTGIDVPGEDLRLVVLLSWPNPNVYIDPYLTALGDGMTKDRAWTKIYSRMADQTVRQVAGRLIRHEDDRGVVALLEPRVRFQRGFRELVRPSTVTTSIEEVERFLSMCGS